MCLEKVLFYLDGDVKEIEVGTALVSLVFLVITLVDSMKNLGGFSI